MMEAERSASTPCWPGSWPWSQRRNAPGTHPEDGRPVAGIFVPVVIVIAVIAFIVWGLVGPDPGLAHALVVAVAVLIIACPAHSDWPHRCRSWSASAAAPASAS